MTPTEQDKELKIAVAKVMTDYGVDFYEGNLMHRTEQRLALIDKFQNDILQLITADRKRVELEARLDELERTMPHTDGMRHYNTVKRRIAELKAQQEEV